MQEQWSCQRGERALSSLVPPQRHTFQIFPLEGAPLGSWNHQACLPPTPHPVLLLQDEKIQSLEELVAILQEQKGKRLSQGLLGPPVVPPLGPKASGWGLDS